MFVTNCTCVGRCYLHMFLNLIIRRFLNTELAPTGNFMRQKDNAVYFCEYKAPWCPLEKLPSAFKNLEDNWDEDETLLWLIWTSNTQKTQLANATLFSCGQSTWNTTKIEGEKQLAASFRPLPPFTSRSDVAALFRSLCNYVVAFSKLITAW